MSIINESTDKSRTEGTYRHSFTVSEFNNLKVEESINSPTFHVLNLPWFLEIKKKIENEITFLSWFIHCAARSKSWSSNAVIEFRLCSHIPTKGSFLRKFNKEHSNWGFPNFMEWNQVLKKENGYVKDDTVTVEVDINTSFNNTIKTNISVECFATKLENEIQDLKKQLKQEQKRSGYLEKEHEVLSMQLANEKLDIEYYKTKELTTTERITHLKNSAESYEELFWKEKFEKHKIEKHFFESQVSNGNDQEMEKQICLTKIKIIKEQFVESDEIWKEKAKNRKLRRENEDLLETQKNLKIEIDFLKKKLERCSTYSTSIKNSKQSNSKDEEGGQF